MWARAFRSRSKSRISEGVAYPIFFVRGEAKTAAGLFLSSLVLRIVLSNVQGYTVDLSTFSAWFQTAAEHGPRFFYEAAGWSDYPPLNVYIFWVFGSMAKSLSLFGTSSLIYVLKLPPNLFDVATAYLIYAFLRRILNFRSAIVSASFYTFNPATIFNTSIWGQFDAIYTFFLILSLTLILDSKPKYSVAAFTLGLLSKPQSIALAPLIAYLIAWKSGWRGVATSALVAAITTLIVISPFKWSSPLAFLGIYGGGYSGYPYTSINAFNVWAFHGFWKPDVGASTLLNFFTIGWAAFGVLTAFTLNQLSKIDDSQDALIIFSAFTLLFSFFMLPTRIHERYLFPVFSVLTLMIPLHVEARLIYGLLSFTYFSNQAYVLPYVNSGRYIADGDHFVWAITLINLAVFLYTVLLLKRRLKAGKTARALRSRKMDSDTAARAS